MVRAREEVGKENMENIQDSSTSRKEQSRYTASLQLVYLRSGFCSQEPIQCKASKIRVNLFYSSLPPIQIEVVAQTV